MDVYSFGFLMWEIYHEQVPFDGDLAECTRYVTQEDGRPLIEEADEDEEDEEALSQSKCTVPISRVIRKCWVKDPAQRPKLNWVIDELVREKSYFKLSDEHTPLSTSLNM